ncbi:hypothetical protein [Pseudomonas glycinae]|uniref:Uncharacterized protein n=1 Tax=Pseudomonas glycinae TaxID=1785145 RepID=A0ABM6QI47_9PSED|nr:hypothetical protein [Pseudomonas glycinae]AUG97620.1 hypothetical protein AWU82_29860 [Pseudomonas glycinae]
MPCTAISSNEQEPVQAQSTASNLTVQDQGMGEPHCNALHYMVEKQGSGASVHSAVISASLKSALLYLAIIF